MSDNQKEREEYLERSVSIKHAPIMDRFEIHDLYYYLIKKDGLEEKDALGLMLQEYYKLYSKYESIRDPKEPIRYCEMDADFSLSNEILSPADFSDELDELLKPQFVKIIIEKITKDMAKSNSFESHLARIKIPGGSRDESYWYSLLNVIISVSNKRYKAIYESINS